MLLCLMTVRAGDLIWLDMCTDIILMNWRQRIDRTWASHVRSTGAKRDLREFGPEAAHEEREDVTEMRRAVKGTISYANRSLDHTFWKMAAAHLIICSYMLDFAQHHITRLDSKLNSEFVFQHCVTECAPAGLRNPSSVWLQTTINHKS